MLIAPLHTDKIDHNDLFYTVNYKPNTVDFSYKNALQYTVTICASRNYMSYGDFDKFHNN